MLNKPTDHIVKSFDEDLKRLNNVIAEMGGLAEAQLTRAVESLVRRNSELATQVVQDDKRIDTLETEVGQMTVRMLALRQPMAQDLREVVAAIKIASDIERIGDYAKNIAKRAIVLSTVQPMKPAASIPRMSQLALQIIKDVLDAYIEKDAEGARAAWRRDEEVDEMYNSLFREMLTYMMEDPRNIGPCTHLLFIAKNIERIGDHATNVAEIVYYLVHGRSLDEERPKGDTTNVPIDA
ncbi:MAG TPA: phosphate signaling complex protein PhoU [Dongiaceae bacterium]|jgi:phosphate transport system protein|nr:phosphate signaling complex protein PhoU [Dongiaceae bacterium]